MDRGAGHLLVVVDYSTGQINLDHRDLTASVLMEIRRLLPDALTEATIAALREELSDTSGLRGPEESRSDDRGC